MNGNLDGRKKDYGDVYFRYIDASLIFFYKMSFDDIASIKHSFLVITYLDAKLYIHIVLPNWRRKIKYCFPFLNSRHSIKVFSLSSILSEAFSKTYIT